VSAVEELVRLIERATGNVIPPRDHRFLQTIARSRMEALGCSCLEDYVRTLHAIDDVEWRTLLNRVTIKESYLFRGHQQLEAISTKIIPALTSGRADRRLRLWSAGCARGEEPATLAVLLMDMPELAGWQWRILATDVDEEALDEARRGYFGARAMERVPARLVQRYFTETKGKGHRLLPEVQQHIEYRWLNLIDETLLEDESGFDVILLRNVLIYFRHEAQRRVVAEVARHLADDGVMFVGLSETLWGLHHGLQPIDLESCFAYGRGMAAVGLESRKTSRVESADTAAREVSTAAVRGVNPPTKYSRERASVSEPRLLGPGQRTRNRSLLLAVEALFAGAPSRARVIVVEGLRLNPDDPVLRALEGLAAEAMDDHAGAIRACRAALYLDPELYQVRLVLARNLASVGWRRRSAQEYERALLGLEVDRFTDLERWQEIGLPTRAQARELCRQALDELRAQPIP